jgi:hypothetical protein
MKKRGKKILRIGGIALAAVLLAVIILSTYVYFHKPALKDFIEKNLSKTPGLTVTISRTETRVQRRPELPADGPSRYPGRHEARFRLPGIRERGLGP